MRYEIEAGDRVRRVTADRTGDSFAVRVDGRLHRVDAARIDPQTLSLIVDSDVSGGRQDRSVFDVTITSGKGGRIVAVNGRTPVAVRLNGRRGRRGPDRTTATGPLRLVAPMPGKVVRVLVTIGEGVRARQPVLVVEAMKMENELRAGRDGTVAEVHVREGMLVEAGALLIVIQ